MADTDEANQTTNDNSTTKTINGIESEVFEAEDIVADAIKLNVDEDLNEQRDDQSPNKSSSFQNGNKDSLDNPNIEDEPNYEIDENDEEQYLKEQEVGHEKEPEKNELSTTNEDEKNVKNQTGDDKNTNDGGGGDKKTTSSENDKKNQDGKLDTGKASESKTEKSSKDTSAKKEDTESTSKSKSSSSKDKSSSQKSSSSSSNDKIVWVSGLSSSAKACDLQTLFNKHGKVVSAKIIKNTKLSGSKLFGVITMETVEQAELCIRNLHKTEFDGKTISVEKNRLEDKKSADAKDESSSKDKKDGEKSSSKRDRSRSRSRSAKRRSFSPKRRFPQHRTGFQLRRGPPFGFRGRGFNSSARPQFNGPPPMMIRKFEVERTMRRREIRAKEMRRVVEDYRRQKDLERRQQEERDKLEREKLRLKYERERLEREKAEFLRSEREKARLERERLEREREELRRKQLPPVTSSRLDDSRSGKRYDDLYNNSSSWDSLDRKRSFSTAGNSQAPLAASTRYDDHLEPSLAGNSFTNFSTYNLLGKLDVGLPSSSSNLRDSTRGSSSSYDRDDRRQTVNGSSGLGYGSTSRSSLSSRERDIRRDRDDWKSGSIDSRRTDSRFIDSKSLTQPTATASQSSYLSSTARSSYDRTPDAWSSAPDRMPPASSLGKFPSSYPPVSTISDRNRLPPNLTPNVMGSTIGGYIAPMSGLMNSNPSYNSNLNTGHRRY